MTKWGPLLLALFVCIAIASVQADHGGEHTDGDKHVDHKQHGQLHRSGSHSSHEHGKGGCGRNHGVGAEHGEGHHHHHQHDDDDHKHSHEGPHDGHHH
ncbi:urease accessory protein UreE-like [Anopheles stephensi]|uniref:urease accessory protein UreE-like n=1 Tax=Anopheles stephensi TaxID=30069 RepID=UPI0007D254C4|nr:urease accessory protein UreE-like [Anopheles stephensi]